MISKNLARKPVLVLLWTALILAGAVGVATGLIKGPVGFFNWLLAAVIVAMAVGFVFMLWPDSGAVSQRATLADVKGGFADGSKARPGYLHLAIMAATAFYASGAGALLGGQPDNPSTDCNFVLTEHGTSRCVDALDYRLAQGAQQREAVGLVTFMLAGQLYYLTTLIPESSRRRLQLKG